jgi:AbrB family looped-hinge helix DNA binding protein
MKTTMDAAGRLVVPKALRTELQIHGPAEVDLVYRDGVIEIRPAIADTRIVQTPEGPVAQPVDNLPALSDDDVQAAIESTRR